MEMIRNRIGGDKALRRGARNRSLADFGWAFAMVFGLMACVQPSFAQSPLGGRKAKFRKGRSRQIQPPPRQVAPKVAAVIGGKPKIVCDELIHDFGDTWVGPRLEYSFTIKNEGDAVLEIQRVKPSCGCTTVGAYPKTIEPHKSGQFKFALNSTKLHGRYRKSIGITTNDPDKPQLRLQLTGYCKRYVDVTPRNASFGKISGEKPQVRVLKIINNTEKPLEIKAEPNGPMPFKFELIEKQPGQKYELKVETIPPLPTGRAKGAIILKTNSTEQPTVTIAVSAMVPSRLELQPNQILLSGGQVRSTAFARTIRFTNYGGNPVKVIAATTNDPELKTTINKRTEGRAYVVSVAFPEKYDITKHKSTILTIETNDPKQPKLTVPIRDGTATLNLRRTATKKRPANTLVGTPAPTFSASTIQGKPVSNSTFKGNVTVLDFFAVNCGFCKKQVPRLETVRKKFEKKGVRFVAVSQTMRKRFDDAAVKAKIAQLGFGGELVIDSGNTIGPLFKATSYPTMVLIGKSGKVEAVNVGNVRDLETRVSGQLQAMLAGKPVVRVAEVKSITAKPINHPASPSRKPRQRPVDQLVGGPAPSFSIATLDGKTISSADFKNAPATVLNFVAANCGFCKKQVPRLEKLRAAYEAKGVRFVNIVQTMRKPFTADEVKKVFTAIGSKIQLAHDASNVIGRKYKASGFPTMVIVGKSGKVEAVNVGNLGDFEARVRGQLDALIAGKPVPQKSSNSASATPPPSPTPVQPKRAPRTDPNALVGKPAPSLSLTTFEGKAVNNSDFANHPATVLNFVASNCGFCKKQVPKVNKVRSDYTAKGVRFVNVVMTMHKEYTPEAVKGVFTGTLGSKMELAHDPKNVTGGKFSVHGFPTMFVIGKNGKVEAVNSGNLGDLETRLSGQLDALIEGKPLPRPKVLAKKSRTRPAEGLVGKPAPKFSLNSLAGKSVSSDDFSNHTATVLNFVATNCGFCKRQVPNVEKVRQQYESQGVRFVNVVLTMRKEYSPKEVKSTFEGIGSKLELAHDPKNIVGRKYMARSFPTMVVVDKSGMVTNVNIGARPQIVQELSTQLDGLIAKANRAG